MTTGVHASALGEPPPLWFGILGPLVVAREGVALKLPAPRAQAVLVVLLVHANRVVSVERLCDELWDRRPPATARAALQVHVAALRRALGARERVRTRAPGYVLEVDDEELDSRIFERRIERARHAMADHAPDRGSEDLHAALALWRGAPFSEFTDLACARQEADRLQDLRLGTLEDHFDAELETGRHGNLVGELRELAERHPYRERLRGQLMLALYRAGRQADALDAYRSTREVLVEELGIEPGAELRELQHAILTQDPAIAQPGSPGTPAAPLLEHGRERAGSTLPVPATALFGRDADLVTLERLVLDPGVRLVTVIGPGGVGKTRLAIEVAHRVADTMTVALAQLAPLQSGQEIATELLDALNARAIEGETPIEALRRVLAATRLVLLLDNFEHLFDALPLISDLVAGNPRLTLLVTSRRPLRLDAERVYRVEPLALPPHGDLPPEIVAQHSAIALFVDRARSHDPRFELDVDTAPAAVAICRLLDGLPLALELAAARTPLFDVRELAARLAADLSLLGAGPADAPDRQRTLQTTLEWSARLLDDEQRCAYEAFAVFAGGATIDAAQTVTLASFEALQALVDQQLLTRSGPRLDMLQTVRDCALRQLDASFEAGEIRDRHARWCLRIARDASAHMSGIQQRRWLARLSAEADNFRAALAWTLTEDPALALELVASLGDYWWQQSTSSHESLRWIDATLEATQARTRSRARVLFHRARLTRRSPAAEDILEQSLAISSELDDAKGMAIAASELARLQARFNDFEKAERYAQWALDLAARAGDPQAEATALAAATLAAPTYETMAHRAARAMVALDRIGDIAEAGAISGMTGYAAVVEERYDDAVRWLGAAMRASEQLASRITTFFTAGNLGLALLFRGDHDRAERAVGTALELAHDEAFHGLVDEPLYTVAALAAINGDLDRAARLTGAADAHRAETALRGEVTVIERVRARFLAPARDSYGAQRWDEAYHEGEALDVHEAIGLTRRDAQGEGSETPSLGADEPDEPR